MRRKGKVIAVVTVLAMVLSMVLVGCSCSNNNSKSDALDAQADVSIHAAIQHEVDSPDWVKNLPAAQDANTKQLFVVAGMGMDKTTAFISMHERDKDGNWKQIWHLGTGFLYM